ncbi:MAG TPA: DUF192 domain-containing protein [Candidatus Nanoarchaeia archaeon]|nr:DUF192 domain-containing protein [Candidatus Nanoarchaeia archaeon]
MKWIFIALILLVGCSQAEYAVIEMKDDKITAKIADTEEARERGLMYVNYMPKNEGMLFIFQDLNQYEGFWMKDTLIPLDIIFIDNDKVVDIIEAEPCVEVPCKIYYPKQKTLQVLEVNKGLSNKIGLKIGDEIKINAFS